MSADDVGRSVLNRALDCAVDLVRDRPAPLPALPASGAVCAELGIGASTFYRLFASVDDYRQQLIEYLLGVPYDAAKMPLLQALAGVADDAGVAGQAGVAEGAEEVEHASMIERLIVGVMASFVDADRLATAPEAAWLPWIGNPTVHQWLDSSLEQAMSIELPAVEQALESFEVWRDKGMSSTDFMKRHFALTIGLKLCDVGTTSWPTIGAEDRLAVAARYWLSLAMLDRGTRLGTVIDESPA